MNNNYLDVHDILVSNEKIPCKVLFDLSKVGFLDPSSTEEDLKAGSIVEISLWLAESLCSQRPALVSPDLPKIYKDTYREILNADACTVDLNKLGIYFYELGCYVSKYDIKGEVAATLMNCFRDRFKLMLSASAANHSVTRFHQLSMSEKRRAEKAAISERALAEWLCGSSLRITTANMVANHRKRKRNEMEI